MKSPKKTGRAALVLLALILASGAFPESAASGAAPKKLATLDDIAALGRTSSLDYARAENAAAVAAAAVPALIRVKSSTLSAEYAYKESPSGSPTASDSVTLSAQLPIIEALGLAASMTPGSSSSVSASLSPLAHSDARTQALIAYAKALAAVDEAGKGASSKAVKAALSWMSQKRRLATAERAAALKKDAYEAAKSANALDPENTTLDDLVTAMKDWSDARSAYVKAQAAELGAETALYSSLGASKADVELSLLDATALGAALDSLESSLAGIDASGPVESYALKAARLDVESGAAKAKSIWAFEPDLSLSAGVSLPKGGSPSPVASIKLSLSLDDIKGADKANAEASLAVARMALALQVSSDRSAYDVAVAALQQAKLNRESGEIARDMSSELADVAAYSYKSGSYSELENEAAVLALASAEDDYFQALADEYSAWLDLAALAGK